MLVISRQSYALTLWTLWHLQQWGRIDAFERQAMQHRAASLHAFAMHEPKKLGDLHEQFVSEHQQPKDRIIVVDRHARVRQMIADHARMRPLES